MIKNIFIPSIILMVILKVTKTFPADCFQALGMQNGQIEDEHITESSSIRNPPLDASGKLGRLNKNLPPWGAWCPDIRKSSTYIRYDEYIEIDLLQETKITMVATQGRELRKGIEFTETYSISYSQTGCQWMFYKGNNSCHGDNKILKGNEDVKTVVLSELNPPIIARYIRIHPGYRKGVQTCLRLELYGCRTCSSVQSPMNKQIPNTMRPIAFTDGKYSWSWPLVTSTSIAAFLFVIALVLLCLLIKSKQKPCSNCMRQSLEMTQPKLSKSSPPEYETISLNTYATQTMTEQTPIECISGEDIGDYDDVLAYPRDMSEKMVANKFENDYEYENQVSHDRHETFNDTLMKSLAVRLQLRNKHETTDSTELDGIYMNDEQAYYENLR